MNEKNRAEFAHHVANPEPHPGLFYGLTVAWGIVMAVITLLLAISGESEFGLPLWQLFLGFVLVWLAASLKRLGPDELGAVLLWGKTMIPVRRGPKIVLVGIFQLERFWASIRNRQFPDDIEFIQKTDDKIPLETVEITLPDGSKTTRLKVRPMRITTAKPRAGEEADILNVQMTVEFTFWVRWIVVDPFLYIVNAIGHDDESRAEAVEKQMRDTGETALTLRVSQLTVSQLISEIGGLQAGLLVSLRETIARWGVEIVDLGLTSPDLSHEMASALRDIPKEKALAVQAKAKAEQVKIGAEAEAYRLEKEASGRGAGKRLELAGEGQGYKDMADILGITGAEALAAQVARDTVGEGDLIVGMDGVKDVIALGKAVLNGAKTKGGEK